MAILVGGTVATSSPEAGMGLVSVTASADFLDEQAPILEIGRRKRETLRSGSLADAGEAKGDEAGCEVEI
jgi:hypothetical protein